MIFVIITQQDSKVVAEDSNIESVEDVESVNELSTEVYVLLVEMDEPINKEQIDSKIQITEEEFDLLTRLVSAEAKGESFLGQVAVANVVFNRVESEIWEDSIKEVIFAEGQFEPVINGSINDKPTESSIKAVEEVLNGLQILPKKVDCFANKSIDFDSWAKHYVTIDNQSFWISDLIESEQL